MPNASSLSFLGIAKEATKGTAVSPTDFIPMSTIEPEDIINYVDDNSLRGSAAALYGTQAGGKHAEFNLGGQVFADTIGYLLAGILGDVTSTGTAPVSHAMSLKNNGDAQPVAFTLTDFYGGNSGDATPARQFAGCQISELGFKWDAAGLLEFSAKATGFGSTEVAKPTASFSAIRPQPAWAGGTKIAGSAVGYVSSGEVDLKRNVTVIPTVNNTQQPYAIWLGPLAVTGKLAVIHEDDTELSRFLTAAIQALEFDWTQGASTTLTELKLHMTNIIYKKGKVNRGKDYIETEIEFVAAANATDAGTTGGLSPILATVKSAKASGTYA